MDPRDQLRRFLEQRRELGEREFVLDGLGVDEVLHVLGAKEGARKTEARVPTPVNAANRPVTAAQEGATPPGTDWRSALTAAAAPGSAPGAPSAGPERSGPAGAGSPPRTQDRPPPPPMRKPGIPDPIVPSPAEGAAPAPPGTHSASAEGEPASAVPLDQIPTGLVVGSAAHELFGEARSPWQSLADVAAAVAACTNCDLHKTARNPVPGVGNPHAGLVCVGEAPGASEDEQGVPFVGQAGQLLTKILAAINLSRDDVFICNVLKHRPPGNRNPLPEEVLACTPYLVRQIELLRPRVLLALGTFAAQTLLQTREPIGKLRGKIHRYNGVPVVVTYHPAALLRNPSWKRPTWEDVQLARRLLDRASPGA